MKHKIGVCCICLGTAFILGALALFFVNLNESRKAEVFAENVIPALQEEILHSREAMPEKNTAQGNLPDDAMPEKTIDGNSYIGYLSIPELNLQLPVMASWDMEKLRNSPCRYSGTIESKDLVLMAHNYQAHFGKLPRLSADSEVYFTDMNGTVWKYQVVVTDILAGEAVEEMTAGEYDLTLFTCAANRSNRITVRCNMEK